MKISFTSVKTLSPVLFALMLWGSPVAVLAQQPASPAQVAEVKSAVVQQGAAVNINTASAEAIAAALTGIGLAKAQAIVAWRDANGAFTRIEQLLEVKGIGQATLDKNVNRISL